MQTSQPLNGRDSLAAPSNSSAGIGIQVMPRIKTGIGLSGMSQTALDPSSAIGHHIGRFRRAGNNDMTAHLQST